jgi:hypothetical protein
VAGEVTTRPEYIYFVLLADGRMKAGHTIRHLYCRMGEIEKVVGSPITEIIGWFPATYEVEQEVHRILGGYVSTAPESYKGSQSDSEYYDVVLTHEEARDLVVRASSAAADRVSQRIDEAYDDWDAAGYGSWSIFEEAMRTVRRIYNRQRRMQASLGVENIYTADREEVRREARRLFEAREEANTGQAMAEVPEVPKLHPKATPVLARREL